MPNFKETHDAEQEEIRRDQRRIHDKEMLYLMYQRRRDIIPCDANSSIILTYFNGVTLDQEKLDEALQHDELLNQLARHQTDQDLRDRLIEEIEELVQGSPQARQHVIASLKYKSSEEIAEQRDELKRRQAIREILKDELKVMARGVQSSQFIEIPALYRSRSMLLALANDNVAEFRSLVKRFGEVQINKILAGKN
jgi:hypothetical protein